MQKETLNRLQKLNQLRLTDAEETNVLSFFAVREEEMNILNSMFF